MSSKSHTEELTGLMTSSSTTSVLLGSGIITTVIESLLVAIISGVIGATAAFFTKRYLHKKYGKS